MGTPPGLEPQRPKAKIPDGGPPGDHDDDSDDDDDDEKRKKDKKSKKHKKKKKKKRDSANSSCSSSIPQRGSQGFSQAVHPEGWRRRMKRTKEKTKEAEKITFPKFPLPPPQSQTMPSVG